MCIHSNWQLYPSFTFTTPYSDILQHIALHLPTYNREPPIEPIYPCAHALLCVPTWWLHYAASVSAIVAQSSFLLLNACVSFRYQHRFFDLLLAGIETVVTFSLAYPAAVALGAVLLQTAPPRGLPGGRMEAFLRAMREVLCNSPIHYFNN